MIYHRKSRRHFLQGMGQSLLALPILPSLLSKAEAQSLPAQKFMVMFWSAHGGIDTSNMYPLLNHPSVSNQLVSTNLYSSVGHSMRSGQLTALKTTRSSNLAYHASAPGRQGSKGPYRLEQPEGYGLNPALQDLDGGNERVSPMLGSFISNSMLNKMNLIAGLDIMYYTAHTNGQTGNFANGTVAITPNTHISTIDRVIGNYPAFYGSATPAAKSFFCNLWYHSALSADWTNGMLVSNPDSSQNIGQAFSRLFSGLTNTPLSDPSVTKKTFILNKVYDDYSRLAKGAYGPGRRISSEDRNKLESFMTSLDSIIKGIIQVPPNTCSPPTISATDGRKIAGGEDSAVNDVSNRTILDLYNQIITASFVCGRTNVFVVGLPSLRHQFIANGLPGQTFNDHGQPIPSIPHMNIDNKDSHQGMFHRHEMPDRQRYLIDGNRWFFQHAFYDLMQKLESVPSPVGGTMLDQSLLLWTQEAGGLPVDLLKISG